MNERGYATLPAAAIICALVFLAAVLGTAGAMVVAQHRAEVAAELAAVAGAWAHSRGEDACAVATTVAELNAARIRHCLVEGADVQVESQIGVGVPTKKVVLGWARAGPL